MVWGKALPGTPGRETTSATPQARASPGRALIALGLVGALTWTLTSAIGLGPSWEVAVVAALGVAGAVRFARASRRVAVVTMAVIAIAGLGWIEMINEVQYGTMSLSGAPPLVRWCGITYKPTGVVAAAPSTGAGPSYSRILRTPSGYDVFGVALQQHHSCASTTGPLFVGVGTARFDAYDPVTPLPVAGAG